MQDSFQIALLNRLAKREREGLKRTLTADRPGLIDFASNDYLGLARSEELRRCIDAEIISRNLTNGSTGSRLLTGNADYTEQVEKYLADFFRADSALIFNSGYNANLAVLSSLPGKDDTIVYDELAHACIKDGARLSLAKRFSFRHNDIDDLESKVQKARGRVFIAVESIYSMDGDESPLELIVSVAQRYNAVIILDEAHSTGVVGDSGRGLSVHRNLHKAVFIRIYTFGKAMGVHGACVVGSNALRDALINFARPFIYTTAPSPHTIASIYCAFEFSRQYADLQRKLENNINLFVNSTQAIQNKTASKSAIQTFIVPGNKNVRAAAYEAVEKGMDVRPILSPTVPIGTERLRICLHSFNTESEIKNLASLLKAINKID